MAATIAVFAPSVWVTVTIEQDALGDDDVHLHAGGQGIWIARMLRQLGAEPIVCAPVGGESGRAFQGLTADWGIELREVITSAASPVEVSDRRDSDERQRLARTRPPVLTRHEVDELYNRTLETALAAGVCVVTGQFPERSLPESFYGRLARDLARYEVKVVGDFHDAELQAFLDAGTMELLKVSDGDLVADGLIEKGDRTEEGALAAAHDLQQRGAKAVVLSRSDRPVLACFPNGTFRVSGPELEKVDSQGSGDSMTAAFAAGVASGLDAEPMLSRAWAAGAANITRRGSGGASPGLIDELLVHVEIERIPEDA
ncbi:1-phosphofructokinase family hexose kinase [Egicoccus sp. AB-alg6-2]|uniref:1-phosphofructokinase family hexose kinase n=1 Tax=Egicoccus sp. AB-alg6-2 TaxID=3242692 RepID=UPI00359E83CE